MALDIPGLITTAANQYGVDPGLAMSIAHAESGPNLNPSSVSSAGALGVMQLMPKTAEGLGVDPHDVVQNIQGGVKYIRQLSDQFGGDPQLIAAAYNAGPGVVVKHGGVPPFPETQAYVQKVTGSAPEQAGANLPPSHELDSIFGVAPGSGTTGQNTVSPAQTPAPMPAQADLDKAFGVTRGPLPAQPATPAPQQPPSNLLDTISGGISTVAQAIPGFTEASAGLGALADVATGKAPNLQAGWQAERAHQAQLQAAFHQQHPIAAPLLSGTGLAAQVAPAIFSGGATALPAAEQAATGFLAKAAPFGADVARNATIGAAYSGVNAAAQPGTVQQRLSAFNQAVPGGAAFGAALPIGAAGVGLANRAIIKPTINALEPFAARFSQGAAEVQAGSKLAASASDLGMARTALGEPYELVPGSPATTGQVSNDTGLLSLERGVAARNPGAFAEVRGAQNAARVESLGSIQSGGDPAQVSKVLSDQFDAIDAQHTASIQAATGAAQAKASAMGGAGTPDAYGAELRGAIGEAQAASKAAYGKLYDAIDPEGKLTANVVGTKTAAQRIMANEPATAAPIAGEEAGVFQAALDMPNLAPARDLLALRVRLNDVASSEMRANGSTATYARLQQLRSAIDQNLATSVGEKVAAEQPLIAAGKLSPGDSTAGRVNQWASSAAPDITDQALNVLRRGQGISNEQGGAGGPSGPTGDTGFPGDRPLLVTPTFDEQGASRVQAANSAYATHARRFGLQPVASALRTKGYAGDFLLPDGAVPSKYFHPGPTGFNDMQALRGAAGDSAMPVIEDYAASSLRKAAGNSDGTIDPAKFARWQAAHADALRALPPETQARFADAASAGQAVSDAAVARTAALKSAQAGAVGRVMGLSDPEAVTRTVGTILGGKTAVADMRALAASVKGNADAESGLRQAVMDHITSKLIGNTEAGTSGVAQIKADQFQTFVKQNRAALGQVLKPDEIDRLDAIAADIRQSKRSETAIKLPGGSNTAQDAVAARGGQPAKGGRSIFDLVGGALGAAVGSHVAGELGATMGAGAGGVLADVVQSLRSAGIQRVDDLVTQGVLKPAVFRALTAKVPVGNGPMADGLAIRRGVTALVGSLIGRQTAPASPPPIPERRSAITGVPLSKSRFAGNAFAGVGLS